MRKRRVLTVLPLVCALVSIKTLSQYPQQNAHATYEEKRDWIKNPATIFDEIENLPERESFRNLTKIAEPGERLKLAEQFLSTYPQSWVLAQVYAIASSGAMASGKYDRALELGKASLEILPEDPLLLVPVSNLELRVGRLDQSLQDCRSALDELDRLLAPASVPEAGWPDRKRALQATCYFNAGRVEVSRALQTIDGPQRNQLLRESITDLQHARALNSHDGEIPYLAGLAYVSLGENNLAAQYFAVAYRLGGPLQSRALEQLRRIYDTRERGEPGSFESYVQSQSEPEIDEPKALRVNSEPEPTYAGSKACVQCHADIYERWSHTGMAKMFRPYRPENVIGDFTVNNIYYDDHGSGNQKAKNPNAGLSKKPDPFARMIVDHGRHYFEIRQTAGWRRYPVDYTIGSKWEQAYATRLPNGEIHVFPVQYNLVQKRWLNFWKTLDAPGSPRTDLQQWENLDIYTNYLANCATCHTSQLRNVNRGGIAPTGLEFREPGIDCEMCHGPASRHVEAMQSGERYIKRPIDPPVDFSQISAREFMAICAQCHEQSAVREAGSEGELNYSTSGDFFQHYKQRPLGEFTRKAFYKDGRFRGTAFIGEALMRSECFKRGNVTCGSCHDPHSNDAALNPTSMKFRDHPDEMCTQCHPKFNTNEALTSHTHHRADSAGSRCTACHMPRTMDALLFEAASHQISEIPNAAMTQRFGRDESPNTCLICHPNQSISWVSRQLAAWTTKAAGTH